MKRSFCAIFSLFTLLAAPALAADATQPHPHHGVLPKFGGVPALPSLSADDLATLAKGEPVLKQAKNADGSGRGIAVQDVHAAPDRIWSRITSFAQYPKWVEGVYECGVYEKANDKIKARFVIGAMMVKEEYFIEHTFRPDQHYLSWTLDYARLSDLDDSVGYWRVEPLPEKPGYSRVYYSVQVKLSSWVPSFVEDMLSKSGLTKATAWVKRESEKGV